LALGLTGALRDKLKQPFGKLYKGSGTECLTQVMRSLGKPTKIIAIGDVTTYYLLKAGIVPDMCLVDDITMRLPVEIGEGTAHDSFKDVRVDNPAGVVTKELMDAIRDNMGSKVPVRIFVNGEEDLAVIPACLYAPASSAVIYGQPNEGVVVVRVTEEKRKETKAILDEMVAA
jgi:GTP-dependent dephospho-CoA kinase